jgi:hypothetical protein
MTRPNLYGCARSTGPHPRRARFTRRALCVTLTSALLTACEDPTAPNLRPIESQTEESEGEHREGSAFLKSRERFTLNLEVTGSLKPDAPIQVRATATALEATEQVELKIVLPEVEFARHFGWKFDRSPLNLKFPAAALQTRSLAKREVVQQHASVVVGAPGYYRAIAMITKHSDEPDFVDGVYVQPQHRITVWFVIDAAGGKITGEFAPEALPRSWYKAPGPARFVGGVSEPAADDPRVAQGPGDPGSRQLIYLDSTAQSYRPAAGVWIKFDMWDHLAYAYTGSSSDVTDANGWYQAWCPYDDWSWVETTYQLMSLRIIIGDVAGPREYRNDCNYGPVVMTFPEEDEYQVFKNMDHIAALTQSYFARSRGRLPVDLIWRTWDPCYNDVSRYIHAPWGWSSYCGFGGDRVQIRDAAPNRAIWGPYGYFTQAHEYGHAFHEKALGGIHHAGDCGASHSLQASSGNLGCAWQEGFADFVAALVDPINIGFYFSILQNIPNTSAGTDGSVWEQAVAGFLLDLTDPVGDESFDQIQYPARYIGDLVAQCRLASGWIYSVNGIDYMVYCLERTVDPSIRGYFPTRSNQPGIVDPRVAAPVGWGEAQHAAVRRLWLWDLRKATPSDPPPPPPPDDPPDEPPPCEPTPPQIQCEA